MLNQQFNCINFNIGLICCQSEYNLTASREISDAKHPKLLTVKSKVSYAVIVSHFHSQGGEKVDSKYGYPTASSITKLVDLSNFDLTYNSDYIDVRIHKNDDLFLRYIPQEDGLSLKCSALIQTELANKVN